MYQYFADFIRYPVHDGNSTILMGCVLIAVICFAQLLKFVLRIFTIRR